MNIIINSIAQQVSQPRLSDLLLELGYSGPAIATALNGQFVAAAARHETELRENDRLEVLAPMQGG